MGGGLDLHVFKNGPRTDLPHLFLTISHSRVSKNGLPLYATVIGQGQVEQFERLPSGGPYTVDRIGAPQEIPPSLTRNTTHSSLRSHHCGAHKVCIQMKYINIVYSSKRFMGHVLLRFEV